MMNLVYYQPWSLMDRWRHEIDELFTRSSDASLPLPAVTNSTAWRPSGGLQVESDGFEHIERVAGKFLRRFTLPDSARTEAIKARYADGVLEIEIPKQPRVETKRITVTVN